MDLKKIIEQVKYNCNISDARYWGYYSICGLLLRLRELYRNERRLMPWESIPPEDISSWIEDRERLWRELENQEFQSIQIDDKALGPFEVEAINKKLNDRGLLYGGGYSTFGKPAFFLAHLKEKKELYDYHVYYATKELCRDLSTSIAMLQGICIFIREEQLGIILWEKIEEMRSRNFRGLLDSAFAFYGIEKGSIEPVSLFEKIKVISQDISDIFIYHEIGEAIEDRYGQLWQDIRSDDRWIELHLRGIKDLLADTSDHGPLSLIIERRDERLLYFYLLFLDGIRRTLFPEIMNSFQGFIESGNWDKLEDARIKGYQRARATCEDIAGIIREKQDHPSLERLIKKSLQKTLNI